MQKVKGKNQSVVRQINQRLVLDLLMKGSKSCTDLAKELKLSNTAVAKIVNELKDQNVVCLDNSEILGGELGRRPIHFRFNEFYAAIAVVDICENSILLCTMAGNKIAERRLTKANVYNNKMIQALSANLREMTEGQSLPLSAICVVTSGILDYETGEYIFANRFENYKGINLVTMFKNEFHVPVCVANDTRAMLIAEQNYGLLQHANNAVLMNVDIGISSAMLIGGVCYAGDKGYAGESGLILDDSGSNLESRASLLAIRQKIAEAVRLGKCELPEENLEISDIIRAFHEGNAYVREVVLQSAHSVAKAVRNLIHLLDCQVVLCGDVTQFGADYLNVVTAEIESCDYLYAKVQFSALDKRSAGELGGIKTAVGLGLESVLRK